MPIVTVERCTRFRCGWMTSGFMRATAATGFLPEGSGTARIPLGHAVQRLVDLAGSLLIRLN